MRCEFFPFPSRTLRLKQVKQLVWSHTVNYQLATVFCLRAGVVYILRERKSSLSSGGWCKTWVNSNDFGSNAWKLSYCRAQQGSLSRYLCCVDLVNEQTVELDPTAEGTEVDGGPGTELLRPKDPSSLWYVLNGAAGYGLCRGNFSLSRTGTLPAVFCLAPPQLLEKGDMEV